MAVKPPGPEEHEPVEIVPSRRTEFVDRVAMMLWVQCDPLSRRKDPKLDPKTSDAVFEGLLDGDARRCVKEAERLWRVRNT